MRGFTDLAMILTFIEGKCSGLFEANIPAFFLEKLAKSMKN
jgi:hypothetical protein